MNKKIKMTNLFTIIIALSCTGGLAACSSTSMSGVIPVTNFEIERYLGDWYEIGRFDFKWEKDLKNVKANYSLNEDGSIKVINSGYKCDSGEFKQSIGKAKFAENKKDIANLKVSFFWPFYSSYRVIALDPDYNYALVAGENTKLLWMLSRSPMIPENVKLNFIQIAQNAGYDLTDFVWTIQENSTDCSY